MHVYFSTACHSPAALFFTEIQKFTKILKNLRVVFIRVLIQFTANLSTQVFMCTVYTNSFPVWGILYSRIMWQYHHGKKPYLHSYNLYVYLLLQGPRFFRDSSQLLHTLPDFRVACHFEIKMEPQSCHLKRNITNILHTKRVSSNIWDIPCKFIYNNFQKLYQKFSFQFIGHQYYLKNGKKKM